MPFAKTIAATSRGVKAALALLVVSATAFIAELIENSLKEVDSGLIEAMKSFGISEIQLISRVIFPAIFRVRFREDLLAIISRIILAMVSILGVMAMDNGSTDDVIRAVKGGFLQEAGAPGDHG